MTILNATSRITLSAIPIAPLRVNCTPDGTRREQASKQAHFETPATV